MDLMHRRAATPACHAPSPSVSGRLPIAHCVRSSRIAAHRQTSDHAAAATCSLSLPRPLRHHGSCRRRRCRLGVAASEAVPEEVVEGEGEEDDSDEVPPGVGFDWSADLFEEGAPPLPKPCGFQQTLISSFTVGGVGLHTGEYAYVRVRPAFAGEGRYFIRVPEGTNSHLFNLEEPPPQDFAELSLSAPSDPEIEGLKLRLFKAYLLEKEEKGFEGSFTAYLNYVDVNDRIRLWQTKGEEALQDEWDFGEAEAPQPRGVDEKVWSADVYSVPDPDPEAQTVAPPLSQRLVDEEGNVIQGVEMLLSALEACGVDNARIEIEGGSEIPVVDGSALGWALDVQFHGVRTAPIPPGQHDQGEEDPDKPVTRMVLRPTSPFVVRDGNAFIQFIPEDTVRLTVGIDHKAHAEIIGKQWKSWCLYEDGPYRLELAGAREYAVSPEAVTILGQLGYYKSGTEATVLVAHQDGWWEQQLVRFQHDEPVRHAIVDLIGDLSLNATSGHAGLPLGHIIAYKPDHELNVAFVKALHANTTDEDWIPLVEVVDENDYVKLQQSLMMGDMGEEEEGEEAEHHKGQEEGEEGAKGKQ